MTILSIFSLLAGAVLAQRFKVMVLMPASVIVMVLAVGAGVTHAQTAWSIVLMAATAATSIQIGYLIGIGIHHFVAATVSSRSSRLAAPSVSTPARHPARIAAGHS
jgi:hypothetical protein